MTGSRSPEVEPVTIWVRRIDAETPPPAAAMLVRMASTHTGTAESGLRLIREDNGRPRLTVVDGRPGGAEGLHVSISHSREHVAAALTSIGPVGVDIEPVRDVPAVPLARRWFTEAEADWLVERPEDGRSTDFLRLWALKEAVGKALGVGLRGGGMRRPVGSLLIRPVAAAGAPAALRALEHVPGIAAGVFTHDGLVIAVACHGHGAVGAYVRIATVATAVE